jgi:hypothetical protein
MAIITFQIFLMADTFATDFHRLESDHERIPDFISGLSFGLFETVYKKMK